MRRSQSDKASQLVRNIAGNPKLETTAGTTTIRTNLALNPSFEGVSTTGTIRTNVCRNPSMEAAGTSVTLRSNLLVNPSMEASSGNPWVRSNLMQNPALATNSTGYTTFGGGPTYSATTMSRVAAPWSLSGWAMKLQGSATSTSVMAEIGFGDYTLAVGTVVTASVYVIAGASRKARLRFRGIGGGGDTFSPDFTLNATTPTRMSLTLAVPAGATGFSINIKDAVTPDPFGASDWIAASMVLIETTNGVFPYFDGTIPAHTNLAKTAASALSGMTITPGVTYAGSTWSRAAVATGTGGWIARQYADLIDLISGETYTASVTVANDTAFPTTIAMDWCDINSTPYTIQPGEVRRVKVTAAKPVYDAIYRFADLQVNQDASGPRSVLFKDWVVEIGNTSGDYYTGTGDYTYAWTGTANASSSIQKAIGTANWALASTAVAYQSSVHKYSGGKSLAATTRGGNGDGVYASDIVGVSAGTSYTFSAWVKTTTSVPLSIVLRFKDGANATLTDVIATTTPSVGVWTRISGTGIAPANSATLQAMVRIYATHTSTVFYVDDALVEASPVLGSYFDGATAATSDFTHAWTGTVNASISEQRGVGVSGRGGLAPYTVGWQSGVRSRSGTKSAAVMAKIATPVNTTLWYPDADYIINSSVNPNTTYTWSVYVWVPSGGGTVMLIDATSGAVGTASTQYDRWERLSVTVNTAAAGSIVLRLRTATTVPAGTVIWVDDELLEQTPALLEYFDGANPIQNLATDPKPTTLTIPANGAGWNSSRWFGSGGAGTHAIISNATDGPLKNLNAYVRKTWTTGWGPGDTGFNNTANGLPVSAGATYTISSYMRTSATGKTNASITITWRDAGGANIGSNLTGTQQPLTAGVWTRLSITAVAPTNAVSVYIYSDQDGGTSWVPGDTLDATGLLIEKSATLNPYYAGTGDYTYEWSGTANASTSLQRAVNVNLIYGSTGLTRTSSSMYTASGKSIRLTPVSSSSPDSYIELSGMPSLQTGKTYTVSATMNMYAPQTGTLEGRARRVMVYHSGGFSSGTQAPNVAGEFRSSVTFTVTDGAQYQSIRCYNGASAGNGEVWWDDVLVEETPVLSPYFDGSKPASGDFTYAWAGTANTSASNQQAVTVAATTANRNTAGAYAASKFYVHQSTAEDGKKTAKWVSPAGTPDSNWRIATIVGSTTLGWDVSRVKAGGTYTLMLQYRASGWSAGQNMSVNIADATSANPVMNVMNASLAPSGWTQYRRTFQATRNATTASTIYMSLPVVAPVAADGVLEIRNWMLTEGEYTGDYIDGNSPLAKWEGTPNASTSIGYPPQLLDLAGTPELDLNSLSTTLTLPNNYGLTEGRTFYTVINNTQDIPTGVFSILTYGDTALNDTVPNSFLTLRQEWSAGASNIVRVRRTGGGGPQQLNSYFGANVICWGMDSTGSLFIHNNNSPEATEVFPMAIPHQKLTFTTSSYHTHTRTLMYRGTHSTTTRAAMSRYLGNKYGANVA